MGRAGKETIVKTFFSGSVGKSYKLDTDDLRSLTEALLSN